MSIVVVASAYHNETDPTTSCTITIPATVGSWNDLYCVVSSCSAAVSLTCTDNDSWGNTWTEISETSDKAYIFWKKATSATASKTITIANAVDAVAAGMSAFRWGISWNPTTNISEESNSSWDETHNGFTPDESGSMICFAVIKSNTATVTNITCSNPWSLEPELFERNSWAGTWASVIFATRSQVWWPTNTGSITRSQTNTAGISVAFAIAAKKSKWFFLLCR